MIWGVPLFSEPPYSPKIFPKIPTIIWIRSELPGYVTFTLPPILRNLPPKKQLLQLAVFFAFVQARLQSLCVVATPPSEVTAESGWGLVDPTSRRLVGTTVDDPWPFMVTFFNGYGFVVTEIDNLGGGFKYFLCSPLFGEDVQFDEYFSKGLKPPTSNSISIRQRCEVIWWGICSQTIMALLNPRICEGGYICRGRGGRLTTHEAIQSVV